jgi:hypothetical protein
MTNHIAANHIPGILDSCTDQERIRIIEAAKILIEWLSGQSGTQPMDLGPSAPQGSSLSVKSTTLADRK